jgi:hypothetical protein
MPGNNNSKHGQADFSPQKGIPPPYNAQRVQLRTGLLPCAEVTQVDHCIGQGLKSVVQPTDSLEAHQQAPELIFPCEHTLDCEETL